MSLIIVISTGRSGSTFVSRLLNAHPEVLSLNELFGLLAIDTRLVGHADGAQFWKQLADPVPFIDAMVRDGVPMPELIYPYATGRFTPHTGVPYLSHTVLPMLSPDPDQLFDRLAAEVPHWPERPVPDHYRHLFAWLAHDLGHSVVVERTAGSIRYVAELRAAFPEARFVYLTRDGVDCALSMSRHAGFRIPVLAELLRTSGRLPTPSPSPTPTGPPRFHAKGIMQAPIPLPAFGDMWSSMTSTGAETLGKLPPTTWIPLRYEDLVTAPATTAHRLARFLGVSAPQEWLDWTTAQADPSRAGHAARLDTDDLARLREACAPGYDAEKQLLATHENQQRTAVPALSQRGRS